MEALIYSLNAIIPIIVTVVIGYLLKRIGFVNESFAKTANKLVFRIFLPAMLFLNVYQIDDLGGMDLGIVIYSVIAVLIVFLIALPAVILFTKKNEHRGALLQVAFRSNFALIGLPLAQALYGDEGVAVASLLSAVTIPMFNVLAVISLSVFRKEGGKPNPKKILLDVLKNPLIQSVAAGLIALAIRSLLVKQGITFRLSDVKPLFSVLNYLSGLATPLALICLGAQFEFSVVGTLKREIVFGTVVRTLIVPVTCLGAAYILFSKTWGGAAFAALVALFATPVAVSSVPMTQEMGGDTQLAGQLVVWTTLISAFSIFASAFFLRLAGVLG